MTSLIKWTPEITLIMAISTDKKHIRIPNHKFTKKQATAIIETERTCLLGKDSPVLFFWISGSIFITVYGRGKSIIFLRMLTSTNIINGIRVTFIILLSLWYSSTIISMEYVQNTIAGKKRYMKMKIW